MEGVVTLRTAAASLGVSATTVRGDLDRLVAEGVARRIRGGAASAASPTSRPAVTTTQRRSRQLRIATKLSAVVPATGAVTFDASETIFRLAEADLPGRDLRVLTNGLAAFGALHGRRGITATLTGGEFDTHSASLAGPVADAAVERFAADMFFAAADAAHPVDGTSDGSHAAAAFKITAAKHAGHVVLAVDSSRLGHRGTIHGLRWELVDTLVTELDPGDARLDAYRELVNLL